MSDDDNNWLAPAVGVLLEAVQHPPRGMTRDQRLHWRTGYQNAISDLIKMRWPMAAGGARMTPDQLIANDKLRVG